MRSWDLLLSLLLLLDLGTYYEILGLIIIVIIVIRSWDLLLSLLLLLDLGTYYNAFQTGSTFKG